MRPLPASALLPLAISIFGLSPNMVLSVVAFGAMWPVLLGLIGFASNALLAVAEKKLLKRQKP